jgi:hypothetical protein
MKQKLTFNSDAEKRVFIKREAIGASEIVREDVGMLVVETDTDFEKNVLVWRCENV